jgi:enamine deaminase RidA (YjgF/YER057c/UK114 family)
VPGRTAYVYYLPAGAREPIVIDDQIGRPNGVTLTRDGKTLIVDDTLGPTVYAYDVQPDGSVKNKRAFTQLRDIPEGKESGADGMALDREDRLYVTTVAGVQVFDAAGKYLGTIKVPRQPANAAFAGPDKRVLYITAREGLYRINILRCGGTAAPGDPINWETKMISAAFSRASIGIVAALLLFGAEVPLHAKDFIKAERPQQRGYSQAVITEGGKTVWLAGQTATVDDAGKSLAADFEGQTRQIFKLFNATLEKAGGKLGDMVQMTVFITDVRYGDRLTQIRREIFGDNFPGSALITIAGLANPDAKIEIQGVAVIGSR